MIVLLYAIAASTLFSSTFADTPANCTDDDAIGDWQVFVGMYQKDCSQAEFRRAFAYSLRYPSLAYDSNGNIGHWTMVYNQGVEIVIGNRKWYIKFDWSDDTKESYCDVGRPIATYDVLMRQYACSKFKKISSTTRTQQPFVQQQSRAVPKSYLQQKFSRNLEFVAEINKVQSSWTAVHYPEHENMTLLDIQRIQGGIKSVLPNRPKAAPSTPELRRLAANLPREWDWRKPIGGKPSIVTPVRAQLNCGSCYSFASTAAVEARVRLATGSAHKPILSPQDVVDCNPYSEGCDGGFPFLVAGKYAENMGMVEEECNPYKGKETGSCKTKFGCKRHYTTNYKYIGGYYGACNEHLMMLELVHNGPFPVGFEVYPDFRQYKSGIYRHTKTTDKLNKFNPFELTNHAVLLVGYGVDSATNTPYWIIKNSWGTNWGENGFFRILRGSDECGIESMGVSVEVVI